MKRLALAAAIIFSTSFEAPKSYAYQHGACGPRSELLADLAQKYHEAPAAVGLTATGSLIEVLTSDDGSTWTIILSSPGGMSCLVAAGEDWQMLPAPVAEEPL